MPDASRSDFLARMRARSQEPESAHATRPHAEGRGSSKRDASLGASISIEVAANATPLRFWRDVLRRRMLALADLAVAIVARAWARWAYRRLTPAERTAIVGEGELAASIQRKLTLFRDMHLKVVSTRPLEGDNIDQLVKLVDHVIVASQNPRPSLIAR